MKGLLIRNVELADLKDVSEIVVKGWQTAVRGGKEYKEVRFKWKIKEVLMDCDKDNSIKKYGEFYKRYL